MEKKKSIFISLPICCFQKTAALCGFSQVVDYQQICTSIQSFISSLMNYFVSPRQTNDHLHPARLTSYRPEWTRRGILQFVYINVTIGKRWWGCVYVWLYCKLISNIPSFLSSCRLPNDPIVSHRYQQQPPQDKILSRLPVWGPLDVRTVATSPHYDDSIYFFTGKEGEEEVGSLSSIII